MKPRTRSEVQYELRDAICRAADTVLTETLTTSCVNCMFFSEATELCSLANQRPPARVIASGCPKWEDVKQIPF